MAYYYPEEGYLIDEQGRLLVPEEEQYNDEYLPEDDLDDFVSLWESHIPSSSLDWKWTSNLIWPEFDETYIENNISLDNNIPMNGLTLKTGNFSDMKNSKKSSVPSLPSIKHQPASSSHIQTQIQSQNQSKVFASSMYSSSIAFSNGSMTSEYSYNNIYIHLIRLDVYENPKFKCHYATLNLAESRAFRKTQIEKGWLPYSTIFFLNYPTPFTIEVILEISVSLPKRSRIRPFGKINPRDHSKWIQVSVLHAYYNSLNIAGVCPIYIDYTGSPDRYNLVPYHKYYEHVNKELNNTISGNNPMNHKEISSNILEYVSLNKFHPTQLTGEKQNFDSTIKSIEPANGFRRFSEFSSYGVKQYYVLKKFYTNNPYLDNNNGKGYTYTIEEGPICYAKKNWKILASFYGFQSPLKGSICIRVYKTTHPFPRMKLMVGDDEDDDDNPPVIENNNKKSLSSHFENKKFMYTRKYKEDFNSMYIEPLKEDNEINYLYNKENFKHFKHNTNRRNDFDTEWTEVLKFYTFDIPFPGSSKLFLYHTIRAIDNNINPCYRHKLTPLFNKNYNIDNKIKNNKSRMTQKSGNYEDVEEEVDEDVDKGLWDLRSVFYVLPAELEDCTIFPYM